MERRAVLINLVIMFILGSIYLYETNIPPERVSLKDLSKHVGEYVETGGIVVKISENGESVIIYDRSFNHSAMIFSSSPLEIQPGYSVVVRGIVELYRGKYEIKINGANDILVKSHSIRTNLIVLLENPQRFDGLNVRVSGYVVYSKVIYINVTDGTGYAHLIVNGHYTGERKGYFYGRVKNGTVYLENPLNINDYRNVSIGHLKSVKNGKVRVYGWILSYYIHLLLKEGKYTVGVYYSGSRIPSGNFVAQGIFMYDSQRGEYVIRSN